MQGSESCRSFSELICHNRQNEDSGIKSPELWNGYIDWRVTYEKSVAPLLHFLRYRPHFP